MLRDGHMPIVPLCAVDDNDKEDVDDDDDDDDDDEDEDGDDDDDDDDVPVLSPCAGDELGREDLAAHVVPAFHHSAELPPDHDLDEYEGFADNCDIKHDYDHSDG